MSLSDNYFSRSLKVVPGGVHSPVRAFRSVGGTPVFFKRALGASIFSVEETEYIDFCQSFGPLILGHLDPDVSEAVKTAVRTGWSFGACEPYSLELAELIVKRIPWVEKIRFVSSGTEAVMSALRLARAATKRNKILKFDGCYHGHADSLLVHAGSGLAGEAVSDSAGLTPGVLEDTLVAPLDQEEKLEQIFATHGQQIAAVILEPLPANYGLLIQREDFIRKIVAIARKHGSLVIFDEVISGFRVAAGGMAETLGLKPDLVTYGKIIGGGFPVGAYGGRRDLMDLMAPEGPVYQAGTLSANPVSIQAGLATLKKIEQEKIYPILEKRTKNFCNELNSRAEKVGAPWQAVSFASIWWLHKRGTTKIIRKLSEIPADHKTSYAKLFHRLLKKGIYLAPSGYEVGFISLAHTDAVLEKAITIFSEVLGKEDP